MQFSTAEQILEKCRMTRYRQATGEVPLILVLAAAGLTLPLSGLAANPTEAMEAPSVDVVGTTPLPGLATPLRDVPANVQTFGGRDIGRQASGNVADFLAQGPGSVSINSVQGNPFQADINYRGFTASPVLGTPQGLSVFQDGVRINEPFGDVVNWDLITPGAISSMQLMPGSNPSFGLNTLGGALAVYTKSGSEYPGAGVESSTGSFGRKTALFEFGAKRDRFDFFLTGDYFDDRGWADHNPSTLRRAFAKAGWQDDRNDIDVSLTLADNSMQGTQTLPLPFFDNIRQAYTYPDINDNKLDFLTAKGSHMLSDEVVVGGNAYYRKYTTSNFNSNVNGNYDPLADPVQATNDIARIDQDSYGFGAQLTLLDQFAHRDNQLIVGASGDFGRAGFTQDSQNAAFTATRGTVANFPFVRQTDAATHNRYWGLFFSDTLKLDARWTLTAAGRYNLAVVTIADRSGAAPLLNGEHSYARFNPALGVNFVPDVNFTAYAGYNEGMRAPTPIELTCADPDAPCKLPNNFIADPDLKQVVSRTIESGARGKSGVIGQWSAAFYRTELDDDIQFVSSGGAALNTGYFRNVGRTRRQGIELATGTTRDALALSARYSYTDATYRSHFDVYSPSNSSADPVTGGIHVGPGDRIPGIPRHNLKLRVQYDGARGDSLGVSFLVSSAVFARGDENNRDVHGTIPGFAVLDLDGSHPLGAGLELFGKISNLFDRKYANFGLLGENFFNGPGRTFDAAAASSEQFRSPGAPRGLWVGLRYRTL
jgi:iron complex outermembrane receptor protein